jgi:hypothetical protein
LICFLFTITLVTVAQAENGEETEVPDWAKDWENMARDIPILGGIAAMGFFLCCVFLLIPLIIAILICIWIYRDAEKRGKQGILWVILLLLATFFLNIIGLIIVIVIWLIVRPPIKGEQT